MTTAELTAKLRTNTEDQESLMALFLASGDELLVAAIRILGAEISELRVRIIQQERREK